MTTTITPFSLFRHAILLFALVSVCASGATAQSAAERVDSLDAGLISLRAAKRSNAQATLQQWVRLQESLRDLAMIVSDPATDSATAWRALYVAGYGFWSAELFDVSAAMAREVVDGTSDSTQRSLALTDLAQSLENAGLFSESAEASGLLLTSSGQPDLVAINNHALRLLKAGRYEECIDWVRLIELTEEVAHTRIFSARAHAYLGRYAEAAADLRRACDSFETAACAMIERLEQESPEKYWRDDLAYRLRIWHPYNLIDSSSSFAELMPRRERAQVSRFASSYWFNEVHRFYPPLDDDDVRPRMPAELPPGRFGILVIDGVPFATLVFDATVSDSAARVGIDRYLEIVHGPSAWGPAMELVTRANMIRLEPDNGGGTLVTITHAAWQEEWVRRIAPGGAWSTVANR